MVVRNRKRMTVAAALLLSVSLSACGKKKDLISKPSDVAPAPTATSAPGELPAPTAPAKAETPSENTNGQAAQGLPEPGRGSTPPPVPSRSGGVTTPPTGTPQGTLPPPQYRPVVTAPPAGPTQPIGSGQPSAPISGPASGSSAVASSPSSDKSTGLVATGGSVYTQAANDGLITYLKNRNNRVNAASQRLNIATARSVLAAKLLTDRSGNSVISIVLQEGGVSKVYNLSGVTSSGPASTLRLSSSGAYGTTTGSRAIEGTLKCLDADGGCSTSFARMVVGSVGSSSILNVVFRTTPAAMHFDLVGNGSTNSDYLTFVDLVRNSIQGTSSNHFIKSAVVTSYEVPHGKSGFELSLETGSNEFIGLAGDLVAASNSSASNATLARLAPSISNQKSTLAQAIGSAKLIANDSSGTLAVDLKLKNASSVKPEQIKLTLARELAPIVDLSEESLK